MRPTRLLIVFIGMIAGVSAMGPSGWRESSLYEGGLKSVPTITREPNALLAKTVAGRRPGRALDLGVGDGRNAIMLAERGWSVTGVDLTAAAVAHAKSNAAARNVSIDVVASDLEVYDFGKDRWDLIASLYLHGWHDRSRTDVAARLFNALAPGGLLIIEGLAKPEVIYGFDPDAIRLVFGRFRILRSQEVYDTSDWDPGNARHVVRFVGQKPLVSPPR